MSIVKYVMCIIAWVLLTIRLVINSTGTGIYQLYAMSTAQSHRLYWTIENEWIQYQMDCDVWKNIWNSNV